MQQRKDAPAFGEADLSNCDRELIQHPGSVQPHGALLVLETASPQILQASENARALLGIDASELLGRSIEVLGGDLPAQVWTRVLSGVSTTPRPLRGYTETQRRPARLRGADPPQRRRRGPPRTRAGGPRRSGRPRARSPAAPARARSRAWVPRARSKPSPAKRSRSTANCAGYDRVMFYRFDPDGHGEVAAEAKEERLEPYLGLHYPESDIPQRARELYLRNRVRVLVDVNYEPVPLVPRLFPPTGEELDMSMSWLRSMSPLHLQYLKNMGVTATLVVSLVREGKLWGLIACHHYSPKRLPYAMRAACDLVAEVLSTRIAVLENFSQVRTTALIRRMEGRLIEATWTLGAWQRALQDEQRDLMRMVGATGAVLVYDDELVTMGDVPSTDELRSLTDWVARQKPESGVFATASLARDRPEFEAARAHCLRRARGRIVAARRRVPVVAARRAGARGPLGGQSAQAGDSRQRSARSLAAPVVRRVDRARPRHRARLVARRSQRGARDRRRAARRGAAGPLDELSHHGGPARAAAARAAGVRRRRADRRWRGPHPLRQRGVLAFLPAPACASRGHGRPAAPLPRPGRGPRHGARGDGRGTQLARRPACSTRVAARWCRLRSAPT